MTHSSDQVIFGMDDLPAGVMRRLTEHYGPHVQLWLGRVEAALASAAERWEVELTGYLDAGWTSVVAFGTDEGGRGVLIKASPDIERYGQERAALAHWRDAPVNRLLDFDDTDQLLLLDAVAGIPGGVARPGDHQRRVAAALSGLHSRVAPADGAIPPLTDDYLRVVVPRVERRAERFAHVVGFEPVARCVQLCRELCERPVRRRMLHADLYAENVLFDTGGVPVFVDPHAKIGSPAFDWAFWCVYYIPTGGFADRLALCREYAPDEFEEALAWSVTLAVDGALFYLDTGDDRVSAMRALLDSEPLAQLRPRSVGYPLR